MHRHRILEPEKTFNLYKVDGSIEVHRGLWAIVDNGYHNWKCLIPPFKGECPDDGTSLWSKRMESVREHMLSTLKERRS